MLHKRRGFTLVELSLVVVVLAVQFAVLMPMLEKNKEEQRKTTCQNNLKECAIAIQLYWNDYDATLPSSVAQTRSRSIPPTADQVRNFLTGVGEKYPPAQAERSTSWAHMVYDHMKDKDSVFCPSDTPQSRCSYWWKYAADLAWRDLQCEKEGDYQYNGQQIILYEHAGWHVGDAAGIKSGIMINVAYMDSHVATVIVQNGPTSHPSSADERTGAAAMRLGAPMYFNYDAETSTAHPGVANYIDPREYCDIYEMLPPPPVP